MRSPEPGAGLNPCLVVLTTPPLPATFGRAEIEAAAAWLVLAARVKGSWGWATHDEIAAVVLAARERYRWIQNRFFRPDFNSLVAGGWAERSASGSRPAIRFTAAGLERVRRWRAGNRGLEGMAPPGLWRPA